ncbi:glycoside hydrolase family 3 protein [Pseudobutyrivibrio sp.]
MVRIETSTVQPFEEKHITEVRELAPECVLFLKREDTSFPVQAGGVALYGSGARKTIKGGTGSGDVNVRHFVTIEEGLERAGFSITSKEWLDKYDHLLAETRVKFIEQVKKEAAEMGINPIMYGMGKPMPEPEYEFELNGEGDLAIYVLSRISGEGADRADAEGDINLTKAEIRDILACRAKYKKFVLVLNVGGMVNLEPVMDVENILLLSQLGTPTGDVLADVLLGKSFPSGKLAMTWAPIQKYPSTEGFGDMDDTVYNEGIYVGYRYFDTAKVTPTFPFGFGLSYTKFDLKTESVEIDESEVCVNVRVTNIGDYPGKEVVQLYSSSPVGELDKPYQELRAFTKTKKLLQGQSVVVSLKYNTIDMASYDERSAAYILEAGNYILRVGNSSKDTTICAVAVLNKTVKVSQCKNICPGAQIKPLLSCRENAKEIIDDVVVHTLSADKFECKVFSYSEKAVEIPKTKECSFEDIMNGTATVDEFVATLSNEELAYLCIGLYEDGAGMGSMVGAAAKSVAGAAGETTDRLIEKGVPTLVMADGPAGIRVCTQYKKVGESIKAMDNPLAGMMDFMEPEQLKMMAEMAPKPTEEELAAPINYVYCIAIPIGTALAQSFSQEVCLRLGDIVGAEMEMFGIHLWLAPAMNIQRSPLCGRDFEYYSEDPLVSGLLAASIDNGVRKHKGCGTTIKHFALNNQETNRIVSNSVVSERAIREIYLKNFEICIRNASPATIMSSYNLVNGVHANNSRDLLTHILRDEWEYEGFVMTDWYAANPIMAESGGRKNKHSTGNPCGCIYAGNDMIMPGMTEDFESIMNTIDNPDLQYSIDRAMLQACARRVINVIAKV